MIIEEIVIKHLLNNGYIASAEALANGVDEYIVVEKTGSNDSNYIKRATIAIQSYSISLYKASCLNEKIKDTMQKLIEKDEISRVKLNSDYNFTDTQKKKYRYQAIYEITYY